MLIAKCVAVNRTGNQAGNQEPVPRVSIFREPLLRTMKAGVVIRCAAHCGWVVRAACYALRLRATWHPLCVRGERGAWCVVRGAWCVVRAAWCVLRGACRVVRTAYCGFGLRLALLSQIASTCPQQSDRQASVAGSGATYTDMCAVVKLASD